MQRIQSVPSGISKSPYKVIPLVPMLDSRYKETREALKVSWDVLEKISASTVNHRSISEIKEWTETHSKDIFGEPKNPFEHARIKVIMAHRRDNGKKLISRAKRAYIVMQPDSRTKKLFLEKGLDIPIAIYNFRNSLNHLTKMSDRLMKYNRKLLDLLRR